MLQQLLEKTHFTLEGDVTYTLIRTWYNHTILKKDTITDDTVITVFVAYNHIINNLENSMGIVEEFGSPEETIDFINALT